MKKKTKRVLLVITAVVVILAGVGFIACINSPLGMMAMLHAQSKLDAGTWEDDPQNWHLAFGEDPPDSVSVVHSKYWGSDHFTHEYIFFFEVKAAPEWQESFLHKRGLELVAPSNAWGFQRSCTDLTPDWFAPDPVEQYEVWDRPKYHGSVWINKTNGHMHFYGVQL